MTINSAAKLERHPPLARDYMGNLLAIPDGTAAWRICRETAGRPSEIKGPDKQSMRFPLDTTSDELVELCGPGVYRAYALDEIGKQLAHVSTWDLTPGARDLPRNTASESSVLAAIRPNVAAAPVTDLRFALEAMTQMMRTHTDALRMVAESQVDLAKTIATAKGLPRNAAVMQALPVRAEDDAPDDDGEDEDEERPRHWVELLMPFAEKAAAIVPAFVMGKVVQTGAAAPNDNALGVKSAIATDEDEDLASRPNWELRDLVDFQYASRKAQAKRAKRLSQAPSPAPMTSLHARIAADPALIQHLLAIKAQLAPDEIETLMNAIAGSSQNEQTNVIEHIKSLPIEAAVQCSRDIVQALREQRAATQAE